MNVQEERMPRVDSFDVPLQQLDRADWSVISHPTPASHQLTAWLMEILFNSPSIETALLEMAQRVGQWFQADFCAIELGSAAQAQFFCWQPDRQQPVASTAQLGLHPVRKLRDWQTIGLLPTTLSLAADLQHFIAPEQLKLFPYRAVLMSETQHQAQANGRITLLQLHPHSWSESDVQLLSSISRPIAATLAQASIERQLQQHIQGQRLIDRLIRAVRETWELSRIFQLVAEGTTAALEVSRATILTLKYTDPLQKHRAAGRVSQVRAIVEWDEATQNAEVANSEPKPSFWITECSLCQRLLANPNQPIVISNWQVDRAEFPTLAPIFNPEALPSLVLLPLEHQEVVLGCLVLQQSQPYQWREQDLTLVKLIAAQLSTAIIQTRTLQQVQSLVEERTAQLQRSLDVQAKLYEKTRQQVEQLRQMNELREEFISTVSHELLTPLTSMTLAIRMLRQANLPPDRQTKYLDILEQQCVQETRLINDLLALQKLEDSTRTAQLQKLDIRYLVRDLAQSIAEEWGNLQLAVNLPEKPLTLYTDPESLSRILQELLTNARKYSQPNSSVTLTVNHQANPHHSRVVLSLCNVGVGIPPQELPYIFDKFRRGQGMTQKAIQGTGLGLALVKGLAEHLGGAIAASSQPLDVETTESLWQTCFTLTLPQYPEGTTHLLS